MLHAARRWLQRAALALPLFGSPALANEGHPVALDDWMLLEGSLQRGEVRRPSDDEDADSALPLRALRIRVAGDVALASSGPLARLRLRGDLPFLDLRGVGPDAYTRLGDPTFGLAWVAPVGRRWGLVPELSLRVPVLRERFLGREPATDRDRFARAADGLFVVDAGLTTILANGPTWWEFSVGGRFRDRLEDDFDPSATPPQLRASISVAFPVYERFGLHGQVGTRGEVNLPPNLSRAPRLDNGVGPEAQGTAWWVDLLWQTEQGLGLGAGVDGPQLAYATPPELVWRLRIVWRPAIAGTGRGFRWGSLREDAQ